MTGNTNSRARRWGRLPRRRLLAGSGSLVLSGAAAWLLACGGGDKDTPTGQGAAGGASASPGSGAAGTGAAGAAAGSPTAAGAAKVGGTLPLVHGAETITLDAHTQESYASQYPVMLATNGLLWIKPKSDKDPADWEIAGDLATKWEQPDPQSYLFTLHPGVKYHNLPPVGGRELTAEDVVYNLRRIATPDPKFRMRTMFEVVDKVEAVDKLTVRLTTKTPYAPMTYNLAYPWANMFAREVVEAGEVETKLVGTGPWMLSRWVKDVGLTYERHPDYFKKDPWTGAKLPYADKVELINLFDVSTQIAAMRAGKIATLSAGSERRQDILRTNSNLTVGPEVISVSFGNLMMNTQRKPFDDVRVRQAVLWATERSEYWLSVSSEGVPSGPMSSGTKPWALPESDLPKTPDLTKAKQLLAAAGYPNGLEVTSSSTAAYTSPQFTEVTKVQLAKIGIKVNIQMLDNATWITKVFRGQDYQTSSYHGSTADDPDRALYDYYHSKGGANQTNLRDEQLDQLLERQRTEMEYAKRKETVLAAQRRLLDLSPRVFIHNTIAGSLWQPWFKGFRPMSAAASAEWRSYQFSWVDKA